MRTRPFLPLSIATLTCGLLTASPVPLAADEVLPGIHRLAGIEETLPTGDLAAINRVLRRVDVVGLGEDVHTTRGFSRAKFRLFKYLVEERDFRVLGIESSWIEAEAVARYVATCEGSALTALEGLFEVWQNESVRDLVEWMCDYNRRHPDDPVHFYGFDHQQSRQDAAALESYLVRFGLKGSSTRVTWLDDCGGGISDEEHARCLDALDRNWRFLERRARRLVRCGRATAEEIEWARIHLVGLRSWQLTEYYLERDFSTGFEARDRGMAYIARKIRELRFPEAKTALWAHNAHIANGGEFFSGPLTMGFFLKEELGRAYEAIGLVAYESRIDWPWGGCGSTGRPSPDSVEALLSQLGEPNLFVDLAFPGTEDPFLEPGRRYELSDAMIVPRREFRALIYMDIAEQMVPLAWQPC